MEEYLYPAMEDFIVDFVVDKGANARMLNFKLRRFTLVGATTMAGLLTAPLRDRFGLVYRMNYYTPDELRAVVMRSASLLQIEIGEDAAAEIARRARGTPRIANRLLRRVRDYAQVEAGGVITCAVADAALRLEGIDAVGLDNLDRALLHDHRCLPGRPWGSRRLPPRSTRVRAPSWRSSSPTCCRSASSLGPRAGARPPWLPTSTCTCPPLATRPNRASVCSPARSLQSHAQANRRAEREPRAASQQGSCGLRSPGPKGFAHTQRGCLRPRHTRSADRSRLTLLGSRGMHALLGKPLVLVYT